MDDHFTWRALDQHHGIWIGQMPQSLAMSANDFAQLWSLHPNHFHEVMMYGRRVPVPRWQQAYNRDYTFSGNVQRALQVPALLSPMLSWAQKIIDKRLNGLLVNWYDGALGHRIGAHRDNEKELITGAPIVTISFGEKRVFRLRRWKGTEREDVEVHDASVLVLPWNTNIAWTHEVPASKRLLGQRVSVTIRAFEE